MALRRSVLATVALWFAWAGPVGAGLALDPAAGVHLPQVAYLEDPSGALSVAEVAARHAQFKPAAGSAPNFGFTDSTYWFRIELTRGADDPTAWYLEVGYPPLDHLELYWRAASLPAAEFERAVSGDLLPFHARSVREPQFLFPLELPAGQLREFYLKVRTVGAVTVPLRVLSADALEQSRSRAHIIHGLFFGTLAALALYNLLLFLSIRDVSYLYYVSYVVTAGLAYLGYDGLAYQYLWPEAVGWNQRAHVVLGFTALAFALLFTRSFLALATSHRLLDRSLFALAGAAGLLALLSIWPLSFWASARLFVAIGLPGALAVLASGLLAWYAGYKPARWFLLAWATLIVGLAAYSLRFLELAPANFFTIYGLQIGTGVEMVLLSIALADRINTMKREKEQAQAALLDAARRSERELESIVQERLRELNEVNKILEQEIAERRRAEEALFEMAHHDALTGLPNRLLLKDRFEVTASQTDRVSGTLALLMVDLDDFKRVNDTLGHQVGDGLLVKVTELIRGCVRASDTIARFGGDEFVILLGSLRDAAEAALVADKIARALARPIALDQHRLRTSTSIGIALYPQDGSTMESLLRCADVAMYRAKQAGGNTFYFFLEGAQRQLSLPAVRPE
ncbi:MAG TPA: 7TM diverse intracellular signaling domain-containing protein [Burkholderiales bacterium]|jgi:diguanylate cyclase (GGDEF)-like protein|nr:7TM diverse intracellular signaling domain-containing protein [Burkholderiales bacterium]